MKKFFIFFLVLYLASSLAEANGSCPACQKRGIYVTTNTALSGRMEDLIKMVEQTELDMVVIDVKVDISIFSTKRAEALKQIVDQLHSKGIWVAARIVVFRDHQLAKLKPELALKRSNGKKWKDSQGVYWVDPASHAVWDYNINIAKQAIDMGFDEINLDYIRFPSDGKLSDIRYPVYDGKQPKHVVMNSFYRMVRDQLKAYKNDIVISADVFGYTLIAPNDLKIGQRLEDLVDFFDVVCPMVYPSHYSKGNFGYENPAANPYGVISKSLQQGEKVLGPEFFKIRPWIQDFSIRGVRYDSLKIRQEKKAVYDNGLGGWLLWNAGNKYTKDALDKK